MNQLRIRFKSLAHMPALNLSVRFTPKTDMRRHLFDVRFVPIADISKISAHDPYAYKKTASRRRAPAVV